MVAKTGLSRINTSLWQRYSHPSPKIVSSACQVKKILAKFDMFPDLLVATDIFSTILKAKLNFKLFLVFPGLAFTLLIFHCWSISMIGDTSFL